MSIRLGGRGARADPNDQEGWCVLLSNTTVQSRLTTTSRCQPRILYSSPRKISVEERSQWPDDHVMDGVSRQAIRALVTNLGAWSRPSVLPICASGKVVVASVPTCTEYVFLQ